MTGSRSIAVSVGTLIAALAFWFSILVIPNGPIVGMLILGAGLAFAMYSVAGFSGAEDPMSSGFAAALTALLTASALAVFATATDIRSVLVLSPIVALSVGGIRALAPTGDKQRNVVRLGASAVVIGVLFFLLTIEVTAFGLIAPLLPLPAIAIADRFYDRGREVIDEKV